MVGFSLKKKDDTPKKGGFGGFSLKKKEPITVKKPLLKSFGKIEKEDDEEQVVKIDTFDSKDGAYDKETGPVVAKGKPVIPNPGNSDWRKITKERFNPSQPKSGVVQEEMKKMKYGLNFVTEKNSQALDGSRLLPSKRELETLQKEIEEDGGEPTMEDYEAMPVEDFGAAMLRGMGWVDNDENEKKEKPVDPPKKRPGYLGLGATAPPDDGKDPEDKEYMPPFKLVKRGNRDKSPTRQADNYRDRN